MKIELAEGKYTYLFDEATGKSEALRYGEKWRDTIGDGLILAMAQRIEDLENQPSPAPSETARADVPVGEIVLFGGDCKEVSWRKGRMPEVGAKLYTRPPANEQPAAADLAKTLHYPDHWDTAAYPTMGDALAAVVHDFECGECKPEQPAAAAAAVGVPDDEDPRYAEAVAHVRQSGRASPVSIQRALLVGYNRAARYIERMESEGIISAASPIGARAVIATTPQPVGGESDAR